MGGFGMTPGGYGTNTGTGGAEIPGLVPGAFNGGGNAPTGSSGPGAPPFVAPSAPPDLTQLIYRLDNLTTVVKWMAPEHRDMVSWSTPIKFFVPAQSSQLGAQATGWVNQWKLSCQQSKGKAGGSPLGQAQIFFGSRLIQYILGTLQQVNPTNLPSAINRQQLMNWAEYHAAFKTAEEWKASIHTCIVQSKTAQFDKAKGSTPPGAEGRILIQLRPKLLLLDEWKAAMLYITLVVIPTERATEAQGQGLLPAERALWE